MKNVLVVIDKFNRVIFVVVDVIYVIVNDFRTSTVTLFLSLCHFRTIFTGAKRHTFIDPDYSYTDAEAQTINQHKQKYIDFIETLRSTRLNRLAAM